MRQPEMRSIGNVHQYINNSQQRTLSAQRTQIYFSDCSGSGTKKAAPGREGTEKVPL